MNSDERAVLESISAERLMADTEAIAQWVRLSGSQDERRAFEYVGETLTEMGLEPELHLAPAYVSLPERATLRIAGEDLTAITHSLAASTPPDGLRLPVVDDGARDVAGRIVVLDGMAMPRRVLEAERRGAAAAIFVNADEHVHEMGVSTVWGSPTPETRDALPRIPAASVAPAAGARLRAAHEAHLTTVVRSEWTEIPTLTADLRATRDADHFVLFSGHIDSWHHGAMDNGTANAATIECARALMPHRDRFRRNLRLAFWSGHSHARYAGSAWYADAFWEELHERCVLHLNIDSVGGKGATVLTEAFAMAETRAAGAGAIADVTGERFTGTRFGRAGDQSFHGHGIPSLFMSISEQPPASGDAASGFAELIGGAAKSGGLGWWWHTPEDTVDKIDPDFLVRDTRIYALTAHRFLTAPTLPLDVEAGAEDVRGHLEAWAERAGDRFDLSTVLARATEVCELAGRVGSGSDLPDDALMAIQRPLVRLNYTRGDPFGHDPAMSQPPVPLLAPIDDLVGTEPGSDAERELLTLLVRRRNQVAHELALARDALRLTARR